MTTATAKTSRDELDVLDLFVMALLNSFWYLVTGVLVTLWWAILFPMLSLPVLGSLAIGWRFGWPAGALSAGVSVAGIMLWRFMCPQMFERAVTRRARSRHLTWWRYRRQWRTRLTDCGLTMQCGNTVGYPIALEIRIGDITDRLIVRMLPGQTPAVWAFHADRLALVFGARACAVCLAGEGQVELVFWHWDPPVALLDDGDGEAA